MTKPFALLVFDMTRIELDRPKLKMLADAALVEPCAACSLRTGEAVWHPYGLFAYGVSAAISRIPQICKMLDVELPEMYKSKTIHRNNA